MSTAENRTFNRLLGKAPGRRPRCPRRYELALCAQAICLLGIPLLMPASSGGAAIPAQIESPSAAGVVVFPHLYHVDELGFECRDCHHETEAAPLRMPHPEYLVDFWLDCKTCHRNEVTAAQPQSCGACHGHAANIADQTSSSKVAIHRSCWQCHEVGTGAEASRGCDFCHEVADEE